MKLILDISKFATKFFFALMVIMGFCLFYLIVPKDEFHKITPYEGMDKNISYLDYFQFSVLSQFGMYNAILVPKTVRTRVLTILQFILGYSILLI